MADGGEGRLGFAWGRPAAGSAIPVALQAGEGRKVGRRLGERELKWVDLARQLGLGERRSAVSGLLGG